jgi:hypothetical protein
VAVELEGVVMWCELGRRLHGELPRYQMYAYPAARESPPEPGETWGMQQAKLLYMGCVLLEGSDRLYILFGIGRAS